MKRTAPLHVLDEYAKNLTKKQVSTLYETKMNKKYTKRLYESDDDFEEYSLYIDAYVMEDNDIDPEDLKDSLLDIFDTNINIHESTTGFMIYAYDKQTYEQLLVEVEEAGIPTSVLNDVIDQNYLN